MLVRIICRWGGGNNPLINTDYIRKVNISVVSNNQNVLKSFSFQEERDFTNTANDIVNINDVINKKIVGGKCSYTVTLNNASVSTIDLSKCEDNITLNVDIRKVNISVISNNQNVLKSFNYQVERNFTNNIININSIITNKLVYDSSLYKCSYTVTLNNASVSTIDLSKCEDNITLNVAISLTYSNVLVRVVDGKKYNLYTSNQVSYGETVEYSRDGGRTWAKANVGLGLYQACKGKDVWVLGGYSSSTYGYYSAKGLYYSYDGCNWYTSNKPNAHARRLSFDGNRFLACEDGGYYVNVNGNMYTHYSYDGITWYSL